MQRIGNIYFHGERESKKIALTFDDGPSDETLEILDLLKEYDAKATFFVWAQRVKGREQIIKSILTQGCEIGNHSYHHKAFFLRGNKYIKEEIEKTDKVLSEFGIKTDLFRLPKGASFFAFNLIGVAKKLKKKIILFDLHSYDYLRLKPPWIAKFVLKNVKKGSIVGFHDYLESMGRNNKVVPALKLILPELKKRGYKMVTVSELLK